MVDSVATQAQPLQAQANSPLPQHTDVQRPPSRADTIRALSQTFGNIPGVPIFSRWGKRLECSNAAVHRSIIAGICGNRKYGTYSIALSGRYKDDEDGGDVIIYTGSGGRQKWNSASPQKRLHLGPQVRDQCWDDGPNRALLESFRTGKPVRVIRSWRCVSKYAPLEGYRYDGLYIVASCWTAKGVEGFKICRCRLERLPDQPPVPERPITVPAPRKGRRPRPVDIPNVLANVTVQTRCSPYPPREREMATTSTWFNCSMNRVDLSSLPDGFESNSNDIAKEDVHRSEDDATLVPSEDGRTDHDVPLNECLENYLQSQETVYFDAQAEP